MNRWQTAIALLGGAVSIGVSIVIVLLTMLGTWMAWGWTKSWEVVFGGLFVVVGALLLFRLGVWLLNRDRPAL
jgi:hypothetical protein